MHTQAHHQMVTAPQAGDMNDPAALKALTAACRLSDQEYTVLALWLQRYALTKNTRGTS